MAPPKIKASCTPGPGALGSHGGAICVWCSQTPWEVVLGHSSLPRATPRRASIPLDTLGPPQREVWQVVVREGPQCLSSDT